MGHDRDDKKQGDAEHDAELTARIRRERRYSLGEAIARQAGDSLKGASPVPPSRQLLRQIGDLVDAELSDSEGSLARTILARLADNPPLLARHPEAPADALAEFLDSVLASPSRLADLVRRTDARWGRDYDERPRFERGGQAPAADDPYTVAGVRSQLQQLRRALNR